MPRPRRSSSPRNNPDPLTLIFQILNALFVRGGGGRRGGPAALAVVVAPVVLAVLTFGWYLFQPRERKEEVQQLVGNYSQQHKHIRLTEVLWDIWTLYFSRSFVHTTTPPAGAGDMVYGGEPQRGAFPHSVRSLYNSGYVVGYCDVLENPVWAAYRVFDLQQPPRLARRPESFVVDTRTAVRVEPGDYTGSGYDRGHMAPNYAIGTRYGWQAQEETFFMSNVCPQRHRLNAGLWKELELRVADNYTGRFGQVWVLAGPIFGPEDRLRRIGGNVPVPEAFYMIVVQQHEGGVRVLPIVVDQEAPASGELNRYLTTVAEIERRTGLNFFPKLDKSAQAKLETIRPGSVW